jgi:hypothetical protein
MSNCILLALSKVSDSSEPKILLNKVHQYGIHGIPHNLIKSCLANRALQLQTTDEDGTCFKDYPSNSLPVKYESFKGSVLIPLLFIIQGIKKNTQQFEMYTTRE